MMNLWQLRSCDRDHCRITLNSGVFCCGPIGKLGVIHKYLGYYTTVFRGVITSRYCLRFVQGVLYYPIT